MYTVTGTSMGDPFPATEDWDNEEWSGSLSDTKVRLYHFDTWNGGRRPTTRGTIPGEPILKMSIILISYKIYGL